MKLFYTVLIIVTVCQGAIYFLTTAILKQLDMTNDFYEQKNINAYRLQRNAQYQKDSVVYKQDSIRSAIIVDNLINHIVPDGKDLSKSFLTLIVAVLVAAITFGEKVVEFVKAQAPAKSLIISSWIFFSIAIVFCGLGIVFLMWAEGAALNLTKVQQVIEPVAFANDFNQPDYFAPLIMSTRWFFHSGITFCLGLVMLMAAGIISNIAKRNSDNHLFQVTKLQSNQGSK